MFENRYKHNKTVNITMMADLGQSENFKFNVRYTAQLSWLKLRCRMLSLYNISQYYVEKNHMYIVIAE